MAERPIPGYYCAYLEFEDGTPATIMHNSYGYFLTSELVPRGTDRGRYTPEERVTIRKALRSGERDENQAKDALRLGGDRQTPAPGLGAGGQGRRPWVPDDLGILIVSCERGDIRQSPHGLYV